MIEISNVSKTFKEGFRGKKVQALNDVSLNIRDGEVFGFLGPNGAGKSTIIKILLSFILPDQGTVEILGRDVRNPSVHEDVGYLPENPYFYDHLTAMELLWFGAKTSGVTDAEFEKRANELLGQVDLIDAKNRRLRTYSKGMVQRAGLAFSLIHDPKVIVLDEPMSGLDPIGRKMVADMILSLKDKGKTVFFSTHIINDVERICDRVGIIAEGKLRYVDELKNIAKGRESLESLFLNNAIVPGGDS